MTDLQQKEFELLKLFVDICDKHALTYYLVCGSALGAVKYGGFIPWDDDVDVALPRSDYETFLQVASGELPDWVFLQNYRTDPTYPCMGSKLRNSNTTFLERDYQRLPMNQGVFIDVFPLDGYPQNPAEIEVFEKKRWSAYRRRYTRLHPPIHKDLGLMVNSLLYWAFGWFADTNSACAEAEELVMQYPPQSSKLWCNFANSMRSEEFVPREQYGEGAWAEFEGLRVRIPSDYHAYLTQKYGDYSLDPPASKQVPSHGHFVDLEKPYTEYLKF